jgi:bifunctional non-homologous end joining protein LigD
MAPMALTAAAQLPVGPDWSYELKWDGYRGVATVAGGRLDLRSRNGNALLPRFPELAALAAHVGRDAVLDGEVVVLGADGLADFGALRRPGARRTFVAFDLLELDGVDLSARPLRDRRELLAGLIVDALPLVLRSRPFDDGAKLLAFAERHGIEGVVAKREGSVYRWAERSRDWVKVKTAAGRATMARRQETWGH